MSSDRPTKIPDAAKTATAQGNAMAVVVAQLAEVAVALGAIWLRSTDGLSEQSFMLIAGGILAGPMVSGLRGKPKTPTTMLIAGALPAVLTGVAKAKALL